eukprot:GHRR01010979.1.p1 GENE.GHRR01010979.1~~GHRR01010979.1.p1  ORF type:complete len:225 (+),score=48.71 GHRR01010979.1:210-884(+)
MRNASHLASDLYRPLIANVLLPAAAMLALLFHILIALPPPVTAQQWRLGRATYYGAPESFAQTFDPVRGEGSFGILAYGSCGFTNSDGTIPFPSDAVAASADQNPDYAGSCGRCYAVRCKEGLVLNNNGDPVSLNATADQGGLLYLPSISRTLTDTYGRTFPGNPAEAQGELYVQCYDPNRQIIVRIIDTCPCTQVLPDGAPGVAPGGEVRQQNVCCRGPAGEG